MFDFYLNNSADDGVWIHSQMYDLRCMLFFNKLDLKWCDAELPNKSYEYFDDFKPVKWNVLNVVISLI